MLRTTLGTYNQSRVDAEMLSTLDIICVKFCHVISVFSLICVVCCIVSFECLLIDIWFVVCAMLAFCMFA